MFCGNCGNKIFDGELFCSQCGAKVTPISQPVQVVQPAYAQQPTYVVQKPVKSGGVSVLSIVGFSISVLALLLSIICTEEYFGYYGITMGLALFVSVISEAGLGLSIAGVIIASRKNHKLKPMGVVGIVLGAVASFLMMIIMFEMGFSFGLGIY